MPNKNIILAAINSKYIHTNPALLYLKALSDSVLNSSQINIVEFTINENIYDILSRIVIQKPDVVAFSVYIWNSRIIKELIIDLPKVLADIVIVLGGPEVSYNAQQWIEAYSNIDYIVIGAGESGWLALLESDFNYPSEIVNLNNIHLNELPFLYENDSFSLRPDDSFSIKGDISIKNRIVYYESSRGCPFKCSFCLSSRQDIKIEFRDIEKVKEELDFFIKHRFSLVKFVDRTFNCHPEHYQSIWEHLLKNNINTCFHFEINPLLITHEDLTILREIPAGFFQFEIGVQSTHMPTLTEIKRYPENQISNRSHNWQDIASKINSLPRNISIHLDLVFGLPYEGYEQAKKSFNDIFNLQPDAFQPGMLKVIPGTEMESKSISYNMVYQNDSPYRVLQTEWISFEQLNRLAHIEHLVNNLYNSHKYERTVDYLVRMFDSPFCLFTELESYWRENNVNYWLKDWSKTASVIIDFIIDKDDRHENVVKDCLRWDLCFHTGLTAYVHFLKNSKIEKLTKLLHKVKKNHHAAKFFPSNFFKQRKVMIFQLLTREFSDLYNIDKDSCFIIARTDTGVTYHKQIDLKVLHDLV